MARFDPWSLAAPPPKGPFAAHLPIRIRPLIKKFAADQPAKKSKIAL
jgi:hypothetical protein